MNLSHLDPDGNARMVDVSDKNPLSRSAHAKGKIFLQNTEVTIERLVPRLRAINENRLDARIFLRGDKAIAYGQVMRVMGTLNQSGFKRVALITQRPRGKKNLKRRRGPR